ncbi:cytochrome ubiquinol oxidase subunit I [Patulibacter brassicae]|jgi:cytochrome d ubiquinol oxidase subunit I|uniref:Cytochrome ubiquinol oxidase subunit I n=1 Tax=Patulibacter brassicae TaxID=1705717 RepID=A0ABU4VL44_9ACTN|nr:cytochrome ubiquinol oxidase subunit I [Patulibacter brassicae]MDX8152399.1 cytochrome ubiquinol oxidase subunit I [Patulibacter brassicae]
MLLELARWQFAFTTVVHFLFVPLTIGLSGLVALMQTRWVRTGDPEALRMVRFWGKLLLVNFAIGIATGIVQEFQFGMAWSAYSRYVGDVFGAPLAMEGLAAFFLESTFLGLWIFGWDRLPRRVHLASIWLVFVGTNLSAYFILAANAWMQNPVGSRIDPETGNAVLTSIWAVLSSPTAVMAYLHTIPAAILTASALIVGISVWHLGARRGHETAFFRRSAQWGLRGMLVTALLTIVVGHFFGQVMTEKQPMKMAAAEALYDTEKGAGLSLMAIAPFEKKPDRVAFDVKVPKLLSFIATDHPNGTVRGIDDLQRESQARYAAYERLHGRDPAKAEYYPIVGLTYWTFRLMMGLGFFMLAFAVVGLLLARRSVDGLAGWAARRWFRRLALGVLAFGFLAHAMGWIFTEVGRQPWVVTGLLKTQDAVSKLGVPTMVISLSVFIVLYLVIAAIEYRLFKRLAIAGPDPIEPSGDDDAPGAARVPALAY